jgi:uncharacterized protein
MKLLKTLVLAIMGGALFCLLHVPLPWTLGPIAAVSLFSYFLRRRIYWSVKIRNTALILLGYEMGRPFTLETGQAILAQFPMMLLATMITVMAGVLTGWIMYKKTGIGLTSCLLGCVPGGLSQMVILADEMDGTDATAVTIMQTMRMLSVVFVVPFLAMYCLPVPDDGNGVTAAAASADISTILTFAVVAVVGAIAGKWLHLPTATLLGPILSTGAYVLLSGGTMAPLVPIIYINMAQVCVGAYIGSSINLRKLRQYHGMGLCLFGGVLFVLGISLGMGFFVAEFTKASFATAFLSTAPGGLAEMGITALVVGADISTMTAYQLVRLLFIMLLFPYIVKYIVAHHEKSEIKQ